jgi:hypothetical protein
VNNEYTAALLYEIMVNIINLLLQWAPLIGITLEPRQTDSINQIIPLTGRTLCLTGCTKAK